MPLPERGIVVFDLDDTLYPERDFVRSGFRAVAALIERQTGVSVLERLNELFDGGERDPFAAVIAEGGLPVDKRALVTAYREHQPSIALAPEVARLLTDLRGAGCTLGLITDGRTVTQRNKIRALGLKNWLETIVVSEEFGSAKPAERNYRYFETRFPGRRYAYVGNDLAKDFIAPNRLGWLTVGVLEHGRSRHASEPVPVGDGVLPQYFVERLA